MGIIGISGAVSVSKEKDYNKRLISKSVAIGPGLSYLGVISAGANKGIIKPLKK